jgi:hypothetical protein
VRIPTQERPQGETERPTTDEEEQGYLADYEILVPDADLSDKMYPEDDPGFFENLRIIHDWAGCALHEIAKLELADALVSVQNGEERADMLSPGEAPEAAKDLIVTVQRMLSLASAEVKRLELRKAVDRLELTVFKVGGFLDTDDAGVVEDHEDDVSDGLRREAKTAAVRSKLAMAHGALGRITHDLDRDSEGQLPQIVELYGLEEVLGDVVEDLGQISDGGAGA